MAGLDTVGIRQSPRLAAIAKVCCALYLCLGVMTGEWWMEAEHCGVRIVQRGVGMEKITAWIYR